MRNGSGLGLLALLALTAPALAQYQAPAPQMMGPTDPMPVGASTAPVSMAPPGMGYPGTGGPPPGGAQSRMPELPDNLPTAWEEDITTAEPNYLYFSAEYLSLWINNDRRPNVTTSSAPNVLFDTGAMGQPNTVLIDPGADAQGINGVRGTIGVALLAPVEVSGFYTYGSRQRAFASNQTGTPLFARPIQVAQPPPIPLAPRLQTSYLASFPGLTRGNIILNSETDFGGGEANVFLSPFAGDIATNGYVLDFTVGGRYVYISETMQNSITQQTFNPVAAVAFAGNAFGPPFTNFAQDNFGATNHWVGGQFGIRSAYSLWNFLVLDAKANFGFGSNRQIVEISGNSALIGPAPPIPGVPTTLPGGIQAVPSNSGRFTNDVFSTYIDFTLNMEIPVTNNLRINVGYDIFYLSHIARPGEYLNDTIDTRQVPTDINFIPGFQATAPGFVWRDTDFFAQGLHLGLSLTY